MRTPFSCAAAGLAVLIAAVHAQNLPPGQYDEVKVPAYQLPDPLLATDGTRISTPEGWIARRRPELLALFAREVYGATPGARLPVDANVTEESGRALGGLATRHQVTLTFSAGPRRLSANLLILRPTQVKT